MLKEELGMQLYRARTWARMSLNELGEKVGRTKGAIYRWESGATTPDLDELAAICVALGHRFICEIIEEGEAQARERVGAMLGVVPPVERVTFGLALSRYAAMLATVPMTEREAMARNVERFAAKLAAMPERERAGFVDAVTRAMD